MRAVSFIMATNHEHSRALPEKGRTREKRRLYSSPQWMKLKHEHAGRAFPDRSGTTDVPGGPAHAMNPASGTRTTKGK